MSDRTKGAKLGFAVAVMAMAAIPAVGLFAGRAVANDAGTHAGHGDSATGVDAARIAKGRELFNSWSCSACHSLADAKANGAVGPSIDGNANLTEEFIVSRVTNGQGAMPAFGGQMTTEEIADLGYYLTKVAAK